MAKSKSVEELKKENEELKKRIEELESLLNNKELDSEDETGEEIQEIENPYTVTNRAISELVEPRDTMFYLSGSQISLILTAYEFARSFALFFLSLPLSFSSPRNYCEELWK